jgi:phospholipase C
MSTRREFIQQMMMLSGAAGLAWTMPESIKRAVSIDPQSGSTFMDAEHVVILMQENRSFDHCFGKLQGVRGYNDPRTMNQPNGNSVWVQSSDSGDTYAPWRFDINDTKITWMGSIPHSRPSQIDAWNNNKYDGWIDAKRSYRKQYADIPLTMGHYTREDLPFNYAMADAFTICDQNFCSVIGPTRPNRLFFWGGTNRGQKSGDVKAYVRNSFHYGQPQWKLIPEWLEENDIPWHVYQNEIASGWVWDRVAPGVMSGQEFSWLGNFGCNPMEWFTPYHVWFSPGHVQGLKKLLKTLPDEINNLQNKLKSLSPSKGKYEKVHQVITQKKNLLKDAKAELKKWNPNQFEKLSQREKDLYSKAFTTNVKDPDYHKLASLQYRQGGKKRKIPVPKGDILYQFRKDVENGQLPTISWLVAPENFSDHPAVPWYGAWYTSEVLDILTKNPEVWKKTIFILTYDENDGYFDHIPPFVAPNPADDKTGKCSPGINVSGVEYIRREDELREGVSQKSARSGPIGLGFRVPMIIASPWSRGGRVCSEVFDHTSTLQFLEHFINEKYNKQIQVSNISNWRRTICGDLTSAFQKYEEGEDQELKFLERDPYIEKIYDAKFKKEPSDYKKLSAIEIKRINEDPGSSPLMPHQEPGIRPSCGLPYELYVDGCLTDSKKALNLTMQAGNTVFGKRAAGTPFKVYAPGGYLTRESENSGSSNYEGTRAWDYAVIAGGLLTDSYPLHNFKGAQYLLRIYGPNGFFRELKGTRNDPMVRLLCGYQQDKNAKNKLTGNLILRTVSKSSHAHKIQIKDNAYGEGRILRKIPAGTRENFVLDLAMSHGWYDITVTVEGNKAFFRQYSGHVETGEESISDLAMGRVSV